MVTFTANQLLGWDLHITHQAATGSALLCKGTSTLPSTTFNDVQNYIETKKYLLLRIVTLLTPSLGILALLRRPILDQWGTLHTLILCRITSRSKPKMSWPYRTRKKKHFLTRWNTAPSCRLPVSYIYIEACNQFSRFHKITLLQHLLLTTSTSGSILCILAKKKPSRVRSVAAISTFPF